MLQEKNKKNNPIFVYVLIMFVGVGMFCCRGANAFEYDSYGKRDPFVPLVGAAARARNSGVGGVLSVDDVVLQGIVVDANGKRNVIINGEILGEGDTKESITVKSIGKNDVVIRIDDEEHTLKLYE